MLSAAVLDGFVQLLVKQAEPLEVLRAAVEYMFDRQLISWGAIISDPDGEARTVATWGEVCGGELPSATHRRRFCSDAQQWEVVTSLPAAGVDVLYAIVEAAFVAATERTRRRTAERELLYREQLLQTMFEIGRDAALDSSQERILQTAALRLMGNLALSRVCIAWQRKGELVMYERGIHLLEPLPKRALEEAQRCSGIAAVVDRQLREAGMTRLIPLRARNQLIGFIAIGDKLHGQWRPSDEEFLAAFAAALASLLSQLEMLAELVEKQQLERELELARTIQLRLLPDPQVLAAHPQLSIAAFLEPARHVSGDYYDVYVEGDRVVCVVADVCGKGIGAALLMAHLHAAFHLLVPRGATPAQLMEQWNQLLVQHTAADSFVTAVAVELDAASGRLRYCNAGHPLPLLFHSDGRIEQLPQSTIVLGVTSDARYQDATAELPHGSELCLYTDGISEVRDERGIEVGELVLQQLLRATMHCNPCEQIEQLRRTLDKRTGATGDDQTVVLIRRLCV